MKRKTKILSAICSIMLVSSMLLSSCGSTVSDETVDNDIEDEAGKKETGEDTKNPNTTTNDSNNSTATDGTKETNDTNSDGNNDVSQGNKIDPSLMKSTKHGYSNGLMLVSNVNGDAFNYCIDKNGIIQFSFEITRKKQYLQKEPFNGKYFLLSEAEITANLETIDKYVLCDVNGKIIYPEDIGATSIYCDDYLTYDTMNFRNMFADGYILAINRSSTYLGAVNKMAIFDKDLNKIVDYSESVYQLFMQEYYINIKDSVKYFRDGYCAVDEKYYDLRTLNEISYEDVLKNITVEYESDFWKWDKDGTAYKAHDIRTGDIKVDLSEYNTIAHITDFQNGTAGVLFKTDVIYFSIVDETGKLLFEPVKTNIVNTPGFGLYYVSYENGIYVVYGNNANNQYNCYSFDANGLISTKSLDIAITSYARISDGVIVIRDSSVISLFNTKLEPLF